jgi:hypothetical protein
MGRLVKNGAHVELFPEIGSRVPDCRVNVSGQEGFYVEISQRGVSKIRKRTHAALSAISNAAANIQFGTHGMVALLKTPDEGELKQLIAWLNGKPNSGERFEDLAVCYISSLDRTADEHAVSKLVSEPRLFSTTISSGKRGTAILGIADSGAQQLLEAEAQQLPRAEGGIVVLDISSVIGGLSEWVPLIQRRFQPKLNGRIRAVVLLSQSLGPYGHNVDGRLLVNPHARNPLSAEAIALLCHFETMPKRKPLDFHPIIVI